VASGFSDDYYAVLGIDAAADDSTLRRAWRRLALRWHPDRAGAAATATFQKISTAYAVLSSPAARAAYDRRRAVEDEDDPVPSGPAASAPPEQRASAPPTSAPVSSRARAPGVMIARLSGPLNALIACGAARRAEDGAIDLSLNDDDAAQGGMATISMRVDVRCATCAGTAAGCATCGGAGTTDELFSAWLAIPPDAEDGTELAPSALLRGMVRPVRFRVRRRPAS
jgi:molecular chaperone DnaJ